MELKNQLVRTPYLVLFVVLIAVGVGTVSAFATYTFSGNVIITDDLTIGTFNPNDDDTIWMDDSSEYLRWNNGADRFVLSNDLNVDGVLDAGGQSAVVPYNRIGYQQTNHGLSGENDLFVGEDFEVKGDIYADGDFECIDCIESSDITNGTIQAEDIANGAAIKSITVSGEWFAESNEAGSASVSMGSSTNSMCYLVHVSFIDQDAGEFVWDSTCTINNISGNWTLTAHTGSDHVTCEARCMYWN